MMRPLLVRNKTERYIKIGKNKYIIKSSRSDEKILKQILITLKKMQNNKNRISKRKSRLKKRIYRKNSNASGPQATGTTTKMEEKADFIKYFQMNNPHMKLIEDDETRKRREKYEDDVKKYKDELDLLKLALARPLRALPAPPPPTPTPPQDEEPPPSPKGKHRATLPLTDVLDGQKKTLNASAEKKNYALFKAHLIAGRGKIGDESINEWLLRKTNYFDYSSQYKTGSKTGSKSPFKNLFKATKPNAGYILNSYTARKGIPEDKILYALSKSIVKSHPEFFEKKEFHQLVSPDKLQLPKIVTEKGEEIKQPETPKRSNEVLAPKDSEDVVTPTPKAKKKKKHEEEVAITKKKKGKKAEVIEVDVEDQLDEIDDDEFEPILSADELKSLEEIQADQANVDRFKQVPQQNAGYVDGGLWNYEIDKLMARVPDFVGTYAINRLKHIKPKRTGFSFILNTEPDTSKNNGHWVAVKVDKNTIEYYDSFGEEPPKIFMKILRPILQKWKPSNIYQLKINSVKSQKVTSDNCGYFAMKFISDREHGDSFKQATKFNIIERSMKGEKEIERFKKTVTEFGYIK